MRAHISHGMTLTMRSTVRATADCSRLVREVRRKSAGLRALERVPAAPAGAAAVARRAPGAVAEPARGALAVSLPGMLARRRAGRRSAGRSDGAAVVLLRRRGGGGGDGEDAAGEQRGRGLGGQWSAQDRGASSPRAYASAPSRMRKIANAASSPDIRKTFSTFAS